MSKLSVQDKAALDVIERMLLECTTKYTKHSFLITKGDKPGWFNTANGLVSPAAYYEIVGLPQYPSDEMKNWANFVCATHRQLINDRLLEDRFSLNCLYNTYTTFVVLVRKEQKSEMEET